MEKKSTSSGALMHILFGDLRRATHSELTRQGLGDLGQPMILFMLKERGREGRVSAQRELADALHVSPATIAMSLRSLERAGYVEKLPDPTDQRRKAVCLTPKGEMAITICVKAYEQVEHGMFQGFSPEELSQVHNYHTRMLRNLRGELPAEGRNYSC